MKLDLTGRTAIITGAARGIGLSITKAFLEAGASVLLTDILEKEGEGAAEELGGKAAFLRHDVRNEGEWSAAVAKAEQHFGGLDIVVNNAGIETAALITEIEADDFRRVFDINVQGVLLGTRSAFRAMRPAGSTGRGGAIVNIASAAAVTSTPALSIYSASKAAVAHFTRNAAFEAGALSYPIRSNCVMPGMTKTQLATQLGDHFTKIGLVENEAAMRRDQEARIPLKRYGEPHEIASVALFLASDASSYMSGACLPVEGGATLG
ncbi:SDR family oxidoreductase [Mesorhizobium sp. CCNWLW179-1]|uniref:SDR family NAD(P)-dependent oxidoreductase n=1 Tax=unclassified Mesorhizobium TaxID=325217 RepID=UPI00301554DB